MKRKLTTIMILAAMLLQLLATPAWALDPQSAQAYCDQVKQAAIDAQNKYLMTYQPRVDPGKTFEDATSSCLDFISNFNIGFSFTIPSIGDIQAILAQMAQKLLQRVCQSARDQFNKAVSDAQQSVGSAVSGVNQIPGVSLQTNTSTSGSGGIGISGSVNTDGGSTVKNTVNNAVDRVVNVLK